MKKIISLLIILLSIPTFAAQIRRATSLQSNTLNLVDTQWQQIKIPSSKKTFQFVYQDASSVEKLAKQVFCRTSYISCNEYGSPSVKKLSEDKIVSAFERIVSGSNTDYEPDSRVSHKINSIHSILKSDKDAESFLLIGTGGDCDESAIIIIDEKRSEGLFLLSSYCS